MGPEDLRRACAGAAETERLARSVRERLTEQHVTAVYSDLLGTAAGLGDAALDRLGFPSDILACFPDPGDPARFRYAPAVPGFRLRPECAAHRLETVRLHIPSSLDSVSLALRLLRDVLAADPDVAVCLLTRPGTKAAQLAGLIGRWGHDADRVTVHEHHVGTLFAQDDALSGTTDDGRAVLLLPRGGPATGDGPDEELESLGRQLAAEVVRSKLHWEGGNILCDGERCWIGANTIAQNRRALGLSEAQVREALAAELGHDVFVLGDGEESLRVAADRADRTPFAVEGGQADFHIDVDVALLGPVGDAAGAGERPLAAVADCGLWAEHLDEILQREGLFADHFLPPREMKEIFVANLRATMARREPYMADYRARLTDAGYRLIGLPDLRLSPTYDYLGRSNFRYNYVNVLPWFRGAGGASALGFRFGFPALDRRAAEIYAEAGIAFVPLNATSDAAAHEAFQRHGGVHCLISKMA